MLRFVLACLICLSTTYARADVFVIAPPYYVGTDGERVADDIVRAIQNDLAEQHRVVLPLDAAKLVKPQERVWCREGACGERYREAAGAVAVILVRVGRMGGGEGPATSFQIGIQPSPGVEYGSGALLADGAVHETAVKALREALHHYRQGPGPWLEIAGAPDGASIFVDGHEVGTLPKTFAVSTGSHHVKVVARTFAPMTKIVSLQSATDRKSLEFRLEPARMTREVPDSQVPVRPIESPRRDRTLSRDPKFYIGIGTIAIGGVLTGIGAAAIARDGKCENRDPTGVCEEFGKFGPASKASLAVGIPVAVLGIALLTTSVWQSQHRGNGLEASIDLSGERFGFSLRGSL